MGLAILIDFGSTFTKAAVVSFDGGELVYTTKTPSTVKTDARVGLEICLGRVRHQVGDAAFRKAVRLASSSAAGGLRMVVVGLTPSLSMTAGKNAAFGAGARVIKAFSHKLTDENIDEIRSINPEILLLCGGYEGGNAGWSMDNARKLAECPEIRSPVVYAGNSKIASKARFIFSKEKKECLIVRNIIPDMGILDVEPAVEAIRDIFMKRIANMKGFNRVREYVGNVVMPTPAAVLTAGKILARGTEQAPGLGEILIIDVGGATTDVHSFCSCRKAPGARLTGSPEPFAKRTVEGDLGVRESANSLIEAADRGKLTANSGMIQEEIEYAVKCRMEDTALLANTSVEEKFELFLAMEAVRISARRHAGRLFPGYKGEVRLVQKGKDLRNIEYIVGTGGPIVNSADPKAILETALCEPAAEPDVLLPKQARFILDKDYIFYAAGLLSQMDAGIALKLLRNNLAEQH